jgi:hypothetical protein
VDFNLLASRMSIGLDGVRACLILTSDGLTLGIHPDSQEQHARELWQKLQGLGDAQRGFIDVGEEVWVLAKRGPYAAVLVAGPGVRPGLLLDKLEFLLRAAEEARAREASEMTGAPPARAEATRSPRTPLHREPRQERRPVERQERRPVERESRGQYEPPEEIAAAAGKVVDITGGGEGPVAPGPPPPDDESEVDRVALAREFGRLLEDN